MDERDEQEEPQRRARPANEGVRIIGAEEAAAALEKGEAAGRRPEDAPRFGDVPPQPAGPRPAHRFPLPDSVDPASAVPRPPVAGPTPGGGSTRGSDGSEREEPPSLFGPPPSRPSYGDVSHVTDPDVTVETNTDDVFAPPAAQMPSATPAPPAPAASAEPPAAAPAEPERPETA